MFYKINDFLLIIALTILISGCDQSKDFNKQQPISVDNESIATTTRLQQFCPQPEDLSKQESFWVSNNGKWKSFTPSTATKIMGFLGAQWIGVKMGKIICLYQTDEAVAFPLAIEQLIIQPTYEPSGYGWSALTSGRRFCKSASVADCTYFVEPPKDTGNIYKEIKYNPKPEN